MIHVLLVIDNEPGTCYKCLLDMVNVPKDILMVYMHRDMKNVPHNMVTAYMGIVNVFLDIVHVSYGMVIVPNDMIHISNSMVIYLCLTRHVIRVQ
jgi:hypothetical protein